VAVREEAFRLRQLEYTVVPCKGKRAIPEEWGSKRLTAEELRDWLALSGGWDIGIVLNLSGLIDLEYDTAEGELEVRALFDGDIPPTPTLRSRRGLHRFFRRPEGLPDKASFHVGSIEVRGASPDKAAQTIVPPSIHADTKQPYTWLPGLSIHEVAPAELPEAVVERLRGDGPTAPPETAAGEAPIPEGKRNDTLFARACALHNQKFSEASILVVLLDLNRRLCQPPLEESEVREIAANAAKGEGRGGAFIARLLERVELWHDEGPAPYLTCARDGHKEHRKLSAKSLTFCHWLCGTYYEMTGAVLKGQEKADVIGLLEGRAVYAGPCYPTYRRVAGQDGKIYLDLCDDQWQAVEIGADGWRVLAEPPVRFLRAEGMLPLPAPEAAGGTLKDLLDPFLNLAPTDWTLVAAWLAAAVRPAGPYPVLKLFGEHGAGKTTAALVLRALVDPNGAPVRAAPGGERDLAIAASNAWLLCLDNLSSVTPSLSDALCRLATGGGWATRELYSDDRERIFQAMRPVILTSIEDIGSRSDLLDRSLLVELPTIPDEERRAVEEFWAAFEAARPRLLGALLDVVCGALRNLPAVKARPDARLARMADFHLWGLACEGPLGLEPGAFTVAYAANRAAASEVALDSQPVVAALLKFLDQHEKIEDTAAELLKVLGDEQPDLKKAHNWPKAPHVLSAILGRVAPNLRQAGIVATKVRRGRGNGKEKVWVIAKEGSTKEAWTAEAAREERKELADSLGVGKKRARV
jgi:hypothetical protein